MAILVTVYLPLAALCLLTFSTECQALNDILDVRLVNGSSSNEGLVEYTDDNVTWSTTCGRNFGISDVIVICRELGFPGANRAINMSTFGTPETGFDCNGSETSITDCEILSVNDCNSTGAAVCSGDGYLGCFVDSMTDRVLTDDSTNTSLLTIEFCISFCNNTNDTNYIYAGVEFGSECYCGDTGTNYSRFGRVSDKECQFPCSGNNSLSCGGSDRIAIFEIAETVTAATQFPVSDGRDDRTTATISSRAQRETTGNYIMTTSSLEEISSVAANTQWYIIFFAVLGFFFLVFVVAVIVTIVLRKRQTLSTPSTNDRLHEEELGRETSLLERHNTAITGDDTCNDGNIYTVHSNGTVSQSQEHTPPSSARHSTSNENDTISPVSADPSDAINGQLITINGSHQSAGVGTGNSVSYENKIFNNQDIPMLGTRYVNVDVPEDGRLSGVDGHRNNSYENQDISMLGTSYVNVDVPEDGRHSGADGHRNNSYENQDISMPTQVQGTTSVQMSDKVPDETPSNVTAPAFDIYDDVPLEMTDENDQASMSFQERDDGSYQYEFIQI